jgi:hypothetical protein
MNPFLIQESLVLDIDTTILPVTLLFFLYIFFRSGSGKTKSSIIKLSFAFALCLWAKEMTPYILLLSLFLFLWLKDNLRFAAIITASIGLLGTVIFSATWVTFCYIANVSLYSFVEFSILNKALSTSYHLGGKSVKTLLYHLSFVIRWVTPGFVLLLFAGFIERVAVLWRDPSRVAPIDFLWIFTIILWGITNLHMYQVPRYQYPVYGAAVILIGEYLYRSLSRVTRRDILTTLGLGFGLGILLVLVSDDPLLMRTRAYLPFIFLPTLSAAFIVHFMARGRKSDANTLILTLVTVLIAASVSLSVKQTRSYTTSINGQNYGERGFWQTLEYLQAHVGDSVPVIRKDLAYYLYYQGKAENEADWIYNKLFRPSELNKRSKEETRAMVLAPRVKYIVLDQFSDSKARALLSADFDFIQTLGDFDIYRRRSEDESKTLDL